MPEYLVFTLASTLASMGDVAGHERRGTWTWPGRSAILGLLAAARGIKRDGDFSALDALQVSVAVFETGKPMRDYHTVQTIPTAAVKRPQSRPEALRLLDAYELRQQKPVHPVITLRDYRQGVLYGAAVQGPALETLRSALEHPTFHLYLGRKACPLSAPLAPKIVAAEAPEAALAHLTLPPWQGTAMAETLYTEAGPAERIETRHDAPTDRRLWHFSQRQVHVRTVTIRPEGKP
ncbi:type I-E CRISPR-associated protein Cas5/CasD [Dichotomicrobium thermohalophilum]|nr:type I-E CRISPR-associated protein Cas5/CasD [Dichotomicrobium thermohalophilum]